jgi:hypothetical protein
VWVSATIVLAREAECARSSVCTSADVWLLIAVGAGLVLPAYIIGAVVSAIFPGGRSTQ